MRTLRFTSVPWLLCIFSIWSASSAEVRFRDEVFYVGEQLVYTLKWGPFSVGEGFLTVMPMTEIDGRESYHFQLAVNSNEFADAIYKVRTRMHSYVCAETHQLLRFRIYQHEGRTRRNATVYYDWDEKIAYYQRDGEEPRDPVEIFEDIWDPLSVLYAFRTIDLEKGTKMVSLPTTDGQKLLSVDIELDGSEEVTTRLGDFDSLKTSPNTKDLRGVFEKSRNSRITIWFSKDESRLPLIIRSRVVVGSFSATLKEIRLLSEEDLEA